VVFKNSQFVGNKMIPILPTLARKLCTNLLLFLQNFFIPYRFWFLKYNNSINNLNGCLCHLIIQKFKNLVSIGVTL